MKELGIRLSPLKFSSLKYDMTWVVCFQKFIVSCVVLVTTPSHSCHLESYLVFGV